MNKYLINYETYGGSSDHSDGRMLVEAEDLLVAEKRAKETIIKDNDYPTITGFQITKIIIN